MSQDDVLRHFDVARERLEVATELLRAGHASDAASRLYYAFFHAARALLLTRGIVTKTHRGLLHRLTEEFARPGLLPDDMISAFRKAQRIRERADYEAMLPPSEEVVEVLLEHAAEFLDRVERLLQDA